MVSIMVEIVVRSEASKEFLRHRRYSYLGFMDVPPEHQENWSGRE